MCEPTIRLKAYLGHLMRQPTIPSWPEKNYGKLPASARSLFQICTYYYPSSSLSPPYHLFVLLLRLCPCPKPDSEQTPDRVISHERCYFPG